MKKVKKEYQDAYNLYLQKLSIRPHKWGKAICIVCNFKFSKTTGSHVYCSNECRRISSLKKEMDIKQNKISLKKGINKYHEVIKPQWYKNLFDSNHLALIVNYILNEIQKENKQ